MLSPDILVLDGQFRAALGVVRSLSQKGLSIVVGSNKTLAITNYSRYIKKHFTYIHDTDDLEKAHCTILEQVKSLRPKVLMPIMNPSWSIIYTFYDDYRHITKIVPNPGQDVFNNLFDKSYLAEVCKRYGVPIPKTYMPENMHDAISLIDKLPYPVLLKPKKGQGGFGINRVDKKKDLLSILSVYSEMPIIQELIDGEDLELTLLCIKGEPIAGSVYLSIRNYPLPYGPPVACRTIEDDSLMDLGMNFLRKLKYNGVAHLDFRRDRNDDKAKLLDFNVRIAGTNEMSIYSGVDFGYLLYRLSMGEDVKRIFKYETGKQFRWLIFGDLQYLVATSEKWKTVKDFLRWKNVSTNFSITDPLPSIVPILEKMYRIFSK
jgi:predicted ATP-grasp superfamily ATP-dependent carboligase